MINRADDTRERILSAASVLFARAGYKGASIREIAKEANVNIAAVNYHFTSKQNLYWENYRRSLLWLEANLHQLFDESASCEEFSVRMFDLLHANKERLVNSFKMILSGSVPSPEGEYLEFCQERAMTPPGGKFFAQKIIKDIGRSPSEGDLLWAVKSIFTVIVHWTLLTCSSHGAHFKQSEVLFSPEAIRRDIKRTTRVILNSIKS